VAGVAAAGRRGVTTGCTSTTCTGRIPPDTQPTLGRTGSAIACRRHASRDRHQLVDRGFAALFLALNPLPNGGPDRLDDYSSGELASRCAN
jgi:hypothetical protein